MKRASRPQSRIPKRTSKTIPYSRYLRSPFVIIYWRDGCLVFENFLTRRQITAQPLTASLLDFFDQWRTVEDLCARMPQYAPASLKRAVKQLARHSLLQRKGEPLPAGHAALAAWSEWNPAAGFFHLSTRNLRFADNDADEFRALVRQAKSNPIPLPIKRYRNAKQIPLGAPADGEFARVLLERRTWRKFSSAPVPLPALGSLLGLTFSIRNWVKLPRIGSIAVKTSPSGGSMHPIEAYVLARNVDGLAAGFYHYGAADHRLELLKGGATSRDITRLLANQWWYGSSGFVVFLTAVFERTRWKYDYARAYRAVLIEAGHLCQTFCLTATSMGLAPFSTMAFADSKIEKVLGIDGISESALYVTGVGMRPKSGGKMANILSGTADGMAVSKRPS
ncbi:MAG: SagB family peptide dehydrogenase [Acidobacteria bacterium]|nr:SagB family peptide dehydrogenase [Acidobacteriota bacterium]